MTADITVVFELEGGQMGDLKKGKMCLPRTTRRRRTIVLGAVVVAHASTTITKYVYSVCIVQVYAVYTSTCRSFIIVTIIIIIIIIVIIIIPWTYSDGTRFTYSIRVQKKTSSYIRGTEFPRVSSIRRTYTENNNHNHADRRIVSHLAGPRRSFGL
jgi:hypothetical protein